MNLINKIIAGYILFNILIGGFQENLADVDGNIVNLKELTSKKTVVVITKKAPDCPICQTQILRIVENFYARVPVYDKDEESFAGILFT